MTSLQVLGVLLLVVANGFFVAAEFALVKVRLSQIEDLARKGSFTARLSQNLLHHIDGYLSACQLGITLASLALGWLGEPLMARLLTPPLTALGIADDWVHYWAFAAAFVCITGLHITLGEQAPKILAIRTPRPTTLFIALPLTLFYKTLWPLIAVLNLASNLLLKTIGISMPSASEQMHTEEELRLILAESAAGGELSRRERLMMENVLDLEEKMVRQVMVSRREIAFLNVRKSVAENLRLVTDSRHTRFPLCDGELDRVVGMVQTKDLLRAIAAKEPLTALTDVSRKIPFFPETMRLDVLLREFQRNRTHVAMVVDEFGTVSGMITFENVLEELVGPIQDEFDRELPLILRRGQGRFHVDGLCPLDDLVEECGVQLPEEVTVDTTGGLLVELLGHIPEAGEKVRLGRHLLTVLDAEPTRVRRVELQELADADESTVAGERQESRVE